MKTALQILIVSSAILTSSSASGEVVLSSCRIADILFGDISFDILPHQADFGSWESAIIRSSGAIVGEMTVDRGGFAVRTVSQEVVGIIGPDLRIEGWDDVCSLPQAEIVPVREGSFLILNGGRPVGTIAGKLPQHDFELEVDMP